ncbi:MAG: DUF3488 domain-containing protein, partial [Firmicutes bacterium]|nr:DUF3488 domain-containing protein [Bacillota bacterium]
FALAIAFLGEEMGQFFSPLNRIIGTFFLVIFLLAHRDTWMGKGEHGAKFRSFFTLTLATLLVLAPLSALSIVFLVLMVLGWKERTPILETRVGLTFAIYILAKAFIPEFFYVERAVADGINALLHLIFNLNIHYSPSAFGLGWLVIVLGFCCTLIFNCGSKRLGVYFLPFVAVAFFLLSQAGYFALATIFQRLPRPAGFGLDFDLYYLASLFMPMNGQAVVFPLVMILVGLYTLLVAGEEFRALTRREARFSPGIIAGLSMVFAIILFGLFPFSNLIPKRPSSGLPTIFIYDTGMDFKTVPDERIFGVNNGLFGMLFDYLQDWGHPTRLFSKWSEFNPRDRDILLLINPHGQMAPGVKAKILSFIKNGGALFMLGDHTHMFGRKNDYFKLTEELGIKFNFDTAIYFRQLWRRCLRSPYLSWDRLVKRDDFITHIIQGASLSLRYPAKPVIIGQYGWSDRGDPKNPPGYLGDRIYTTDEPTGDVVLAATRNYGKGRILVFGDTSFLQNSPIGTAYPLIRLCLAYLMRKTQPYFRLPAKNPRLVRAGIDQTVYPSYFLTDWVNYNKGLGGLKNAIYRSHCLPYVLYQNDTETINQMDIMFLLSPQRRMTSMEADRYAEFVRQGGWLIVACGYEHQSAAHALLQKFGVEILNQSYSFLAGKDTDLELRFVSAWPLRTSTGSGWKVLCRTWDERPVVIERTLGKGKAVFIGDSFFFEERNLEQSSMYYKNNVDFIEGLLSPTLAKGGR